MALKFTVHGVQSFIKGHRKSGVISTKHSRDITNRITPLTVKFSTYDCHIYKHDIIQSITMHSVFFRLSECLDKRNKESETPLHLAMKQKRTSRVLKLLEFKAGQM